MSFYQIEKLYLNNVLLIKKELYALTKEFSKAKAKVRS